MKINLGCGNRKKEGYLNVDINPDVKPDLVCNVFALPLPFPSGTVDEIHARHVIEHLPQEMFMPWMEEIWRILKPNGLFEIIAPHASSMYGYGNPFHYWCPILNIFSYFEAQPPATGERYTKVRFTVVKQQLVFWGDTDRLSWLARLMTPFNWLCHGPLYWQMFLQRFNPLGFDEIHFLLRKERMAE